MSMNKGAAPFLLKVHFTIHTINFLDLKLNSPDGSYTCGEHGKTIEKLNHKVVHLKLMLHRVSTILTATPHSPQTEQYEDYYRAKVSEGFNLNTQYCA